MDMLILFGVTTVVLLLVFTLIGIKVILKPGSEFKKNCGNVDDSGSCSHCGRPEGDVCESHDDGGCEESQSEDDADEPDNEK